MKANFSLYAWMTWLICKKMHIIAAGFSVLWTLPLTREISSPLCDVSSAHNSSFPFSPSLWRQERTQTQKKHLIASCVYPSHEETFRLKIARTVQQQPAVQWWQGERAFKASCAIFVGFFFILLFFFPVSFLVINTTTRRKGWFEIT